MKKLIDFAKKKRGSASGVSETGSLASGRYAMKDKGLSKLHKASSSGDLSKVKQLAKKSDINQVDKENRTALHFACANGNVDIVAHLVEKKCNINVCDSEKRSALMKAVQCEQDRCVSILLTNGADTTLKDIHGNTALHLACLIPTVSMATQLLEHGADINATNKEGFSPLILAVTKNHYEMAEFLLKRGANVNSMDDSKRTSLMIAADNGQSNIVKLLLKYNADITIRDALGQTAEDYAVLKGHHGCSHLIIEHGTKKKSLQSPLIFGTNKGKAVSMFSTPDHVADVGFVLGGPAMEKEVPDDISQDESVSRTSDKVHSEDLWPSDEDEELDFGPKKPQKLNLAKLVSASQQNKKSAKETSSVDRKQLVTVTQTSKSDSEDDSRDDSEDEVLTNQTSPKSVPDNQASQYPTVPSPNSFSKPPQMTSKPLQDACQDSSEENEEEVDGHKTANNGIPKTSSHPLNNLSFDVSCVAPQSREADTKDVKRDILMSELGFEEVDEKEDTESLWDSEPASESPRKSPASNISSPFAGTASKMHNIFEEEQEDMFYIPSFIRGSRYSKMAKVADARVIGRPEGQMGASENSPNIQPNTCAPSSETQQAAHSALVLPNEEETKKQKSDLLEELGVGDADDIEVEASDWDSVSTSNRNLSQGQAAVSLHQKQVDISQKKVELSPPNSENPSMQGTPGKLQPARLKEEVAVCTPKSTEPSTVTVPVPAPRSVERRLDEPPQSQSSNQVPAEKVDSEYSDWDSEDGAAPSDSGRHLSPPVHKSSPPEPEFRAVIPRDVVNKDDEDEDQQEEKKDEQRSTKDAAFLKRGVSSRKGGEIVSENIQHKLSEKPHLKGSRRVGTSNITTEEKQPNSISKGTGHTKERQRETQSMRRLSDKMYDVEDVEKTKQNMVIQADNKLGITKKQSQLQPSLTNGNPLSAFDDSTLSETSQEEERPEIKLSHAKDKIDVNMDIANDLDDITQSSDTATEDVELPTSAFRNAALQFEQFHMDNMDSRSRIKLQSLIQGYERIIEREKSQYNLLLNKVRQLENEKKELQEGTENTRRLNSALEHQKVEWKSDLNSLNFKLKQEEEKHKNTMLLYEKCQEQLQRKDEQYSMELEAHQQLERNVRNLEMEMRTLVSSMKQIEEERNEAQRSLTQERSARALQDEILNNHLRRQKEIEEENKKMMSKNTEVVTQLTEVTDREKDFSHQNRMLQDEISVLRLELERVRARSQDEEGKYMNENETLKEKAEDLKRDLKLSEEALTQTIFQFNGQLNALKSENTKLNTKLENEKQNREKAETELDSVRSQLTSAVQEMERCQTAKTDIERALQRERDDGLHSQDKLNQEISKLHEMNKHISLQLSKAETKVSSLENDLHRSTLSVTEKTLLLESAQRDLSQNQSRVKEVENLLQLEKDQVSKYNVRQESLQERLAQIQSENMLLRQQLEDAQNKGIIKEKAVSDVQDKFSDIFTKLRTDSERQVHMVEDRNKELINKNNELREQVHRYENEKAEREGTVRQLQQELADALKKLSMSEASLEVITRYRNSLEEEKAYLQKDLDKLKDKLEETEEQYIQSERRIHELKSALDDKEREVIAASQKVQEVVSVSSGMEKTVRQLEEHVQRLEIENAKLEAAVKQQANRTEATQKELQESVMRPQCMTEGGDDLYEDSHVRNRLEDMITSLQGTKINLEEQLNQQIQKQNVLSLSAQDSRNLWEEELKTKSKLGLRLTQLDREKAELEGQVETEKKKAKKLAEQKRSVETTLEREIQRNSELQKDVNKMKALLKTTKKKLKEQETGEQASYFGNIQAEQDHSRYGIENTVSMLKSKVDDFSQRLEMESTKSAQLESSNRELKEQLISLKMLQKSHERLEKSKRQLEDELNNLKRHVEANIMEQSQADQYKREIEERARQEIRQKLEEVNLFLQAQAASQEALEQIRASNEASQRNQMEQRIRDLESELNRAKNTQQDSIIQKETNQSELERYKELYAEELRLRKTLSAKLDRANERLSETNAKLLSERQRTKSIIAGGIVNGSLNSSPSLDVNPFYLTSNLGALNRSLGLGGSFLSPVTDAFPSNNKVDSYLAKMHIELDKNITKELDEATAELNIGSTRISPVGSAAGSSRSLDQDPLTRATQQYLEVLKKNFKI
ncbi:ankyrin repeat domain-containing protein 26-like isoform X7 [Protopterus annectens]|uniref:ankyrin repeat domain-containing protein 26-like isoform X7 n=1 Tax=Protopterus annectens TaxID=7888 RepID=UPI001CFAAC9C|nr:ankyrin repeat domain-containing protein 26-like isoform X7 [Protopterus annectens]